MLNQFLNYLITCTTNQQHFAYAANDANLFNLSNNGHHLCDACSSCDIGMNTKVKFLPLQKLFTFGFMTDTNKTIKEFRLLYNIPQGDDIQVGSIVQNNIACSAIFHDNWKHFLDFTCQCNQCNMPLDMNEAFVINCGCHVCDNCKKEMQSIKEDFKCEKHGIIAESRLIAILQRGLPYRTLQTMRDYQIPTALPSRKTKINLSTRKYRNLANYLDQEDDD